jgi:predicted RND superfamily exporter protein
MLTLSATGLDKRLFWLYTVGIVNKEREMKSAQDKFNEYLSESRETMNSINELTNRTNERYEGYAFAAGALGMILADAISELPKRRRAEFRDRILKIADKARTEYLMNQKEPA